MHAQKKQSGLSIWAFLFTAAVIGFFAFLFMKLFPPYYDNLRIDRGLQTMVDENDVSKLSKRDVINRLNRLLLIDYVDNVVDMNKAMKLNRTDRGVTVTIRYEEVVPIVHNLSALIDFENTAFSPYR